MGSVLGVWRLLSVGLWIIIGLGLTLALLNAKPNLALSGFQSRLIRWWASGLLSRLGISLTHNAPSQAPIWVANHHSWLDIMVLMAIEPSRFLSKAEVAQWPAIGWLAKRAGTVFIQRGAGNTQETQQQLQQLMQFGDHVVFFPEGTTYDHAPARFHPRLFALAIDTQTSVAPITLVYHDQLRSHRPDIAYVGTQTLMQNLWHLVQQRNITAVVTFNADISAVGLTRDDLATAAQSQIMTSWLWQVEEKNRCLAA
jgi:1-acyl-sn-glycerol-3-phosphate acyltransferase